MFSELSGVRILLLLKYLFFYTEGIQIPESGIFLFLESGIPGFGIQKTVHGIRNTTKAD